MVSFYLIRKVGLREENITENSKNNKSHSRKKNVQSPEEDICEKY